MPTKRMSVTKAKQIAQRLIIHYGVTESRGNTAEVLRQYDEDANYSEADIAFIRAQCLVQGDRVLSLFFPGEVHIPD